MEQPKVNIVHKGTGGRATVPESVFTGKGGLKDNGWILEADLPKRPTKKAKLEEETEDV